MNKKLNILFICGWYPSRVSLTNGDFIQRHAEAVSLKNTVSVLHIITDKNCSKNIEIESKEINGIKTHIGYVKKTNSSFLKLIRFWRAYFILLQKTSPFDVVHLNEVYPFGLFALHLKWLQKIPFIISEHWTGYHFPQSKNIRFIERIISKIISKNASFICPVSDDLGNSMQKIGLKGNYHKVPNVVDTSLFKAEKKANIRFQIIHISSLLDPHKNISGMLRVARKLEDTVGAFTWKFIGGVSQEFSSLLKTLNFTSAKIEFINHISQEKLVKELQNASVFVLFSNYENLPCVILESFSTGTSVITTNVGGIAEYFPTNFGSLIEKGNESELHEKLLEFSKKETFNETLMHNYAKSNFSKDVIANTFSTLYKNALNNKN